MGEHLRDGIEHAVEMTHAIKERHPEVPDEGWRELDAIQVHLLGTLMEPAEAVPRGLCEVCNQPFTNADLEDGVTVLADCCDRGGLCRQCRKKGNHDCD